MENVLSSKDSGAALPCSFLQIFFALLARDARCYCQRLPFKILCEASFSPPLKRKILFPPNHIEFFICSFALRCVLSLWPVCFKLRQTIATGDSRSFQTSMPTAKLFSISPVFSFYLYLCGQSLAVLSNRKSTALLRCISCIILTAVFSAFFGRCNIGQAAFCFVFGKNRRRHKACERVRRFFCCGGRLASGR